MRDRHLHLHHSNIWVEYDMCESVSATIAICWVFAHIFHVNSIVVNDSIVYSTKCTILMSFSYDEVVFSHCYVFELAHLILSPHNVVVRSLRCCFSFIFFLTKWANEFTISQHWSVFNVPYITKAFVYFMRVVHMSTKRVQRTLQCNTVMWYCGYKWQKDCYRKSNVLLIPILHMYYLFYLFALHNGIQNVEKIL